VLSGDHHEGSSAGGYRVFCLMLGACGSAKVSRPLHSSFEDLSSEVETKSGIALEFDSALNIGGLSRLITAGDRSLLSRQGSE
jgi:hypothetical protein